MLCGLFLALSVTTSVAVREPLTVGLKVTVIEQVSFGAMVAVQVFAWVKSLGSAPVIAKRVIVSAKVDGHELVGVAALDDGDEGIADGKGSVAGVLDRHRLGDDRAQVECSEVDVAGGTLTTGADVTVTVTVTFPFTEFCRLATRHSGSC
jgi:hypothetical protein